VTYIEERELTADPFALLGDFNILPEARDARHPDEWEGSVLFNPEMRERFQGLLDLGLVDAFRKCRDEDGLYSWWDYRQLGFPKNNGLRIDHILASPALADTSTDAYVDRDERKGQKPSDHAPVFTEFDQP
jgi:exodeoxyribonuclease-3